MTVLHVITSLDDGGAEAVLFRLVSFDQTQRHVVVSLGGIGKYGPMLSEQGTSVHALDMPRGRLTISGLRKLWRVIKSERPRVIQTWLYHGNLVGGVVAKLAGISSIYWGIHNTALVPGTTGRATRAVDWLCARISNFVPKRIIACAQASREIHVANGYAADKFSVIPNGYDVKVFAPDPVARLSVRRQLGLSADAIVVGHVARWDSQKDHANFISAFNLVRKVDASVQLVLVGSGCDAKNDKLVALLTASQLRDGVHLLGRRADVPALMNAFDLHILSSFNEAFPNVVAEAMACGTPCVVTDVGDATTIVGDTGWVVPPKDREALGDAMIKALAELRDVEQWRPRQSAARERIVTEFSLNVMVARYLSAWAC